MRLVSTLRCVTPNTQTYIAHDTKRSVVNDTKSRAQGKRQRALVQAAIAAAVMLLYAASISSSVDEMSFRTGAQARPSDATATLTARPIWRKAVFMCEEANLIPDRALFAFWIAKTTPQES